jgi:hypothetical protein
MQICKKKVLSKIRNHHNLNKIANFFLCQNTGKLFLGKKISKYGKICKFGLKWTSLNFI